MVRYKVFLGAPRANDSLRKLRDGLTWQTIPSEQSYNNNTQGDTISSDEEIENLYANTIFGQNSAHESRSWAPLSYHSALVSQFPAQPASSPSHLSEYEHPPPISSSPQETQDTEYESTFISGRSSILVYPLFSFSIRNISQLSSVLQRAKGTAPEAVKASVLVVVLEVEGPDSVTIKKGVYEGSKVSRLQLTIGDDDDTVVSLTAWRDTAERWGNATEDVGLKKGDVVFLENVVAQYKDGEEDVKLTASPYLRSNMVICYRTMPSDREDIKYRPDLRLAQTDSAVRKVSSVVQWFEEIRRG